MDNIRSHKYVSTIKTMLLLGFKYLLLTRSTGSILKHSTGSLRHEVAPRSSLVEANVGRERARPSGPPQATDNQTDE